MQPRDDMGAMCGMRDAVGVAGHPNGPWRSMSITKLKTIGSWQPPHRRDAGVEGPSFRGRIITGMLTGGDGPPDERAAAQESCVRRTE
jgi:hypothetical protein